MNTRTREILSENMRRAREEQGLSIAEIARRCNWVGTAPIYRYEAGVFFPKPETLQKLAKALGYKSAKDLLTERK